MKARENARFASARQMLELGSTILRSLPKDMTEQTALEWIGQPDSIAKILRNAFMMPAVYAQEVYDSWRAMYKELFGYDTPEVVPIPTRNVMNGLSLIVVAEGCSVRPVFTLCQKYFPCTVRERGGQDGLGTACSINNRSADKTYAVWIRNRMEADGEFKYKSANELRDSGHDGITLLERLLYELKFFRESGEHLDFATGTLCTGTVTMFGGTAYIPVVAWESGSLKIDWVNPGSTSELVRSREVFA